MKELVTLSLLTKKYPDQWVLIGDPQVTNGEISGVLIMHHESKQELAQLFSKKQQHHQFTSTILRYTGTKPEIGKWLRFTPLN